MPDELEKAIWGEFEVTCRQCSYDEVIIESSIDCSEEDGLFGEIVIRCPRCHNEHEIFNATDYIPPS